MNSIEGTPKGLFKDKEHYLKFVSTFKFTVTALGVSGVVLREHYALYSMLRNRDWRRGFTAVTNKRKLENGRQKMDTLRRTLNTLITASNDSRLSKMLLESFGGTVTHKMLRKVLTLIPELSVIRRTGTNG